MTKRGTDFFWCGPYHISQLKSPAPHCRSLIISEKRNPSERPPATFVCVILLGWRKSSIVPVPLLSPLPSESINIKGSKKKLRSYAPAGERTDLFFFPLVKKPTYQSSKYISPSFCFYLCSCTRIRLTAKGVKKVILAGGLQDGILSSVVVFFSVFFPWWSSMSVQA